MNLFDRVKHVDIVGLFGLVVQVDLTDLVDPLDLVELDDYVDLVDHINLCALVPVLDLLVSGCDVALAEVSPLSISLLSLNLPRSVQMDPIGLVDDLLP